MQIVMAKLINNIRFSHFFENKCWGKRKMSLFCWQAKWISPKNSGNVKLRAQEHVEYVQTCSCCMQPTTLTFYTAMFLLRFMIFLCSQGHTNHGMDHATPDLPTLEKPTLDKSITDNSKEESHHLEIWKPALLCCTLVRNLISITTPNKHLSFWYSIHFFISYLTVCLAILSDEPIHLSWS